MVKPYINGTWSNHDSSFCVLDKDGNIIEHIEAERHFREKEKKCDAVQFFFDKFPDFNQIKYHTTCFPLSKTTQHSGSWDKLNLVLNKNSGKSFVFGHHLSHCANSFFSSNYKEATIISLDGGGIEKNNFPSACSIYYGKENKLFEIKTFHLNEINLGGLYGRLTRYCFLLPAGGRLGSNQGSVMSVASYGNPDRFKKDFELMLTRDLVIASHKPPGQPQDLLDPRKEIRHPYLGKYRDLIEKEGWQTEADLAAGLQGACEDLIFKIVEFALNNSPNKEYLCLSGGVSLNCVATGKLFNKFPQLKGIYIPPVCGDNNLSIGSAQYLYHHVLENKRNYSENNSTPFLGKKYSQDQILKEIDSFNEKINKTSSSDEEVIKLLDDGKVIGVFNGRAESGRRALGNRSILADPRKAEMRDRVNKIKSRKFYRPSAPSILREYIKEYFYHDVESPYMSFALKVREERQDKIPAVVHVDGTARLQSVKESDNKWYYNFLKKWNEFSGVPVLLNSSLNSHEPICEDVNDALSCFLKTDLDYLYFPEFNILINKIVSTEEK